MRYTPARPLQKGGGGGGDRVSTIVNENVIHVYTISKLGVDRKVEGEGGRERERACACMLK